VAVEIYDTARVKFASAGMSWPVDAFSAAIPKLGYVPDLRGHTAVSVIQPTRGPVITISNRTLDANGWFLSDPLFFSSSPPNQLVDRIVIYRSTDGALLFHIGFDGQGFTSPIGKPFRLVRGVSRPGLARL
jgi:hypothetical protein